MMPTRSPEAHERRQRVQMIKRRVQMVARASVNGDGKLRLVEVTAEPGQMLRPACNCMLRLKKLLQPRNGEPAVTWNTGGAILYVRPIEPDATRPPIIAASFCPLCGAEYAVPRGDE
jgi:hypothetical protein